MTSTSRLAIMCTVTTTNGLGPRTGSAGRIVIVSGSVGAGHDGVAYELQARLSAADYQVEVADMLDGFPVAVRLSLGSVYVLILRWLPWLYSLIYWSVERVRPVQRLAGWACASATPWLERVTAGADLVVATYPPASRAAGQLRVAGRLGVPVVTYLTDPAPNFMWMHEGVDTFLCAGEHTAAEARGRYGVDARPVGPVVAGQFRRQPLAEAARDSGQAALDLPAGTAYALILMGSLGVGDVRAAVQAISDADVVPVVLCGRNTRLQRRLRRTHDCLALGWRTDVPTLLADASFVVHNAGGLSLSESLVAGVPAVSFAAIAGHGRDNARVLDAHGVAPWARSPGALTALARRLTCRAADTAPPSMLAAEAIAELADASRLHRPTSQHGSLASEGAGA